MFPRELSAREYAWIQWLLPADRPGYKRVLDSLHKLFVIGEGRWGKNDLVLGAIGDEIDRTEGMQPVVAFGELKGSPCDLTLSLHAPNELGQIEFQLSPSIGDVVPQKLEVRSKWTYSTWKPGLPCPATGTAVREVKLPASRDGLRLVIAPTKRVVWLHDSADMMNRLIPVTNFYNELVISQGIRDPKIALDHSLLFTDDARWSDAHLAEAFVRYNVLYKKVGLELFDKPDERHQSLLKRLFGRSKH